MPIYLWPLNVQTCHQGIVCFFNGFHPLFGNPYQPTSSFSGQGPMLSAIVQQWVHVRKDVAGRLQCHSDEKPAGLDLAFWVWTWKGSFQMAWLFLPFFLTGHGSLIFSETHRNTHIGSCPPDMQQSFIEIVNLELLWFEDFSFRHPRTRVEQLQFPRTVGSYHG